jgi:hypothetical protein
MKRIKLIWLTAYSISIMVFAWSVWSWLNAVYYHPVTPEQASLNEFDFRIKGSSYPLSRYQGLLEGGLFFEKPPAPPEVKVQFQSGLVVYGVVKGKSGRAIVELEGDQAQETWIVKPGSVVGGETIVAIGADYVEVKNESGTGKVFIRK